MSTHFVKFNATFTNETSISKYTFITNINLNLDKNMVKKYNLSILQFFSVGTPKICWDHLQCKLDVLVFIFTQKIFIVVLCLIVPIYL